MALRATPGTLSKNGNLCDGHGTGMSWSIVTKFRQKHHLVTEKAYKRHLQVLLA